MSEIRDNHFLTTQWEKRGWGIYVAGTQKRVVEITPSWKSSVEAEEVAAHIVELHNSNLSK